MKVTCEIRLRPNQRDTAVERALMRIYPEGWTEQHGIPCLPETDPRMKSMLYALEEHGIRPLNQTQRIPPLDLGINDCRVNYCREYDPEDLALCSYLQMIVHRSPGDVGVHDDSGAIFWDIRNTQLIEGESFVFGDVTRYCCSDRVRQILESAGLRNLRFRETEPENADGRRVSWDTYGQPWWEMMTDLLMPPMSPSMVLYGGTWARALRGDPMAMYAYDQTDPRVHPPELHYRVTDLASIEPFDIARTCEGYRAVIVSRKFYKVCSAHDLQAKWIPVRVED